MQSQFSKNLSQKLYERELDGNLRKLVIRNQLIDFTSNDYLGLSRSWELKKQIDKVQKGEVYFLGSTGSRLLSGNSEIAESLESYFSEFWNQDALVFNSGYDANLGLWSSIPQKTDTIILDELIHACIIDGARLSGARRERFLHNDLNSLEDKLKDAKGNIYVGIESIYSMDGDYAPVLEICKLCNQYGAFLMVDEAHSTGILGKEGRGLVEELNLENQVMARVFTFGKALGNHGAVVVGFPPLRKYLINFSRTFIYTTALSPHTLISIRQTWEYLRKTPQLNLSLLDNIKHFKSGVESVNSSRIWQDGPIQIIQLEGNENTRALTGKFLDLGMDIRPILYPSVPRGKERIRICLHAFNQKVDIDLLVHTILENIQF